MSFELDPAWKKKFTLKNLLSLPIKQSVVPGRITFAFKKGNGTPIENSFSRRKKS